MGASKCVIHFAPRLSVYLQEVVDGGDDVQLEDKKKTTVLSIRRSVDGRNLKCVNTNKSLLSPCRTTTKTSSLSTTIVSGVSIDIPLTSVPSMFMSFYQLLPDVMAEYWVRERERERDFKFI